MVFVLSILQKAPTTHTYKNATTISLNQVTLNVHNTFDVIRAHMHNANIAFAQRYKSKWRTEKKQEAFMFSISTLDVSLTRNK